jgi:phage terminase small subunit
MPENVHPIRQKAPKRGRRLPAPPRHLETAAAKKLWRDTLKEYELEPHELVLLGEACSCVDRIEAARDAIARIGNIVIPTAHSVNGKPSLKVHPAVQVETQYMVALARLLRELRLGEEAPVDFRVPRLRRSG